ncbi:MAG: hypothetical protein ISS15_21160 [Alphaproteobacteria bacterium]|nr:hypothetical protein [Reyranella sp.]MBL6940089.1 hypothetical protein [Alphaproteobacteria bacterium]MBL7100176.1 hypothetical protein [Alphaproteobacteria bacterium]
MEEAELRPIFWVGPDGIAGSYQKMMELMKPATMPLIWTGLLWYYWLAWPFAWKLPTIVISEHITLTGLITFALIVLTAVELHPFYVARRYLGHWLSLERLGFRWAKQDGYHGRIIREFSNGRIEIDRSTGEWLAREEESVLDKRGWDLRQIDIRIAKGLLGLILVPLVFTYLFDLLGPQARALLQFVDAEGWLQFAIIWILIVPEVVDGTWLFADQLAYELNCQFIPGAKNLQAVPEIVRLEDMTPGETYGPADQIEPSYGARQLSS